jgi:hypothetical protein
MQSVHAAAAFVAVGERQLGVAVRQNGALRFIATDAAFAVLDGSRFHRVEQLEQAAKNLARAVDQPEPEVIPAGPPGVH